MKKQAVCQYCSNEFKYDTKSSTGKYCNNVCQGKYIVEFITKPKIEQGLVREAPTLKKYLENARGYKCETCNISEWKGQQLSLHLDHIDGNSDNNFPTNLRLLCPNCHSQTETFSGRNQKNSKRNTYMQRYRLKNLVRSEGIEPPTTGV